jgi:hypothetical protein
MVERSRFRRLLPNCCPARRLSRDLDRPLITLLARQPTVEDGDDDFRGFRLFLAVFRAGTVAVRRVCWTPGWLHTP